MREFQIEEKMGASKTKMGREYGARFQHGEFVVTGDAVVPVVAIEVWNEQKKLFPVESKNDRKPARVVIAGQTCEVWYTAPNAVYGMTVNKGVYTGQVLKQYVDGNMIQETLMM